MQSWAKILLGVVVVVIVFGGWFFYSRRHTPSVLAPVITSTSTTPVAATSTAGLTEYRSVRGGFAFEYDPSYGVREGTDGPYTGWPFLAQPPSTKSVTVTIPGSTQPQTNLAGAEFRASYSDASDAITKCLKQDPNTAARSAFSEDVVNGIHFIRYQTTDAAAGNLYNTTSFRTLHAGTCYAIDLVLHSGNIGNYPPEMHISEFDHAKAYNALHDIFATFKFL